MSTIDDYKKIVNERSNIVSKLRYLLQSSDVRDYISLVELNDYLYQKEIELYKKLSLDPDFTECNDDVFVK